VAPRSEDPKLIIRVISFELVQPIRHGTGTSTLQTDGQTDGRLTIAIPRFVVRASRGNTRKPSLRKGKRATAVRV